MKNDNALLRKITVFTIFFVFICTILISASAWAVSDNFNEPLKSKGLTLSPLRTELELAPGTAKEGYLTITNSTKETMLVNMNAEEFNVTNDQYDYAFNENSDVVKWVDFNPSSVELAAGKSERVKYRISVPLSAEPGGRYLSMFASNDTSASGNGLSSRQRIASLLYVTVTGAVSREGHLLSLSSPWLVTGKTSWSVALRNTGTTHFRSRRNVQIVSIFGEKASIISNTDESLILPGSVRLVTDDLPLPQFPGVYKIIYTIGLGDTPAKTVTKYILYAPPLAIVLFVTAIMIALSLIRRKRSAKKA